MRILWNEIKKILNWKILLLLLIVNVVLYFLLIEFYITHFPNGRPALDAYRIGVEMIEKYGPSMDEADIRDFAKTYEAKVKEADRFLQSRHEFVEAGIQSYEDFKNVDWEDEKQAAISDKVMFVDQVDLFWELQEREQLVGYHENREGILAASRNDARGKEKARLNELIAAGHYQVYPEVAIENFKDFIYNVAIAVIISVILVIMPVFMRDRSQLLLDMQYTTEKGRNIYKTKVAAGLISTGIVITALLVVYFSLYALNKTSMFLQVPLHAFIGVHYWYDPTFLQYIGLCVTAIYVLGLVFALLVMAFSSVMPNYVTLIGSQLPFTIGMIGYGLPYLLPHMISLGMPQWAVPTLYHVLVVASVIFIAFMWRRERRRDIVL